GIVLGKPGTPSGITVGPAPTSRCAVAGFPAPVTAGVAGSFTVTAKNADGTTNADYRDTVYFTSSDPQAVLPGNYTFTEADQGVHTSTTTMETAGSQAITTRDTLFPGSAGTQAGVTRTPPAAPPLPAPRLPPPRPP